MTTKEIIYSIFYLTAYVTALYTGFRFGFTGSHTPPLPFFIEFLCFPFGLILLLIDLFDRCIAKSFSNYKFHIVGLSINGAVMAYVLALLF